MQPRRCLSPRGVMVLYVMKSGCSSFRELVLEFALLAALAGSPGVETPECVVEDGAVEGVEVLFVDEPEGEVGKVVVVVVLLSELWYFVQRASTSGRERAGRFSRLAVRVSKQKAQWAWVAMLGRSGLVEWRGRGVDGMTEAA